jgi:hypothetical protein
MNMDAKAIVDELIDKMCFLGDTLAFVDQEIWLDLQARENLRVRYLGNDAAIVYRGASCGPV